MDRREVVRKIRQLGARGAHYQFRELREALGVGTGPAERNEIASLHNFHKTLINDGVIEEIRGSRERNKYFRIADEPKLIGFVGLGAVAEMKGGSLPSFGIARIEQKLGNLDDKLA